MEENRKEKGFLGNLENYTGVGSDFFFMKLDELGSLATSLALLPTQYLDEDMKRTGDTVVKYMEENEELKNVLREDILRRRGEIDRYVENNPVRGTVLRLGGGLVEQAIDPFQTAMNFAPGGFWINTITNSLDYAYENKVLYDKDISDYDSGDYLNLGIGAGMAAIGAKYQVKNKFDDPLYDVKIQRIYDLQASKEIAPLNKIVQANEEVKGTFDIKSSGEVAQRLSSGQTQSLPKGFHNGERVAKTIKDGTSKRLEQISNAYKNVEMANKYGKDPIIPTDTNRDIAVKGAVSEAMKPLYTEIELGQRQALGEMADKLVGWNIKNKKYDGITPIGDIIDETLDGVSDEEFVKICQNRNKNDKYKNLMPILSKWTKEAVEIKSQSQILDKEEGFYIDTLHNKQHLMADVYDLTSAETIDVELLARKRMDYIKGQLKNIGRNVPIDDITAKKYGLKKGGYFNLEEHPELLKEFYEDIYFTTKEYHKAIDSGVVEGKKMTLFEVALKWGNSNASGKKEYERILEKEIWKGKEKKIKNFFIYGEKKYKEILKKKKITKKEFFYKKAYKRNKANYEKILETKTLTEKEILFKNQFERQALENLESVFQGYEKKGRDIMKDIISTIADEKSGYNVFKNQFERFLDETESKNINPDKKKNTSLGFLMKIKADGDVEKAIKDSISSVKSSLKSIDKLKVKKYDELSLADKTIYNMKNTSAYKLLWGIRHLREAVPNIGIVNSGGNRLGFKRHCSYIRGMYEMGKVHYDLAKNIKNILDRDLSTITDPIERFETELFIRRVLENNYAFDKKHLLAKAGKIGSLISGSGQLVSDIHRITAAIRFTVKAMFDELPKMKWEEMSPTMRSVLKSNGIFDEISLKAFQEEIKVFKSQADFDDFVLNSNIEKGGKIKSIFEQFVDITGREFEPFEKDLTNMEGKGFISKLWLNSQMLFKRYSMGAFSRAWKNVTTYYDGEDILRYKFIKNKNFQWDSFSKSNWRNSVQGFGARNAINLMAMSALYWANTQAINWAQGKMFGTSSDEIVEAKFEALKTDAVPIVAEGLAEAMTDYIGYDIMFGGNSAFFSMFNNGYRALQRDVNSENLETYEKILYGLAYVALPQNIASGIDNLKFERNIPTKINTFSADAQFLWKHYYRKDAEYEQAMGEFPAAKAITESFNKITDWYSYFKKNPDKVYDVLGKGTEGDKEAMTILATGIMEMTEQSARNEHINFAFAHDDPMEREKILEEYGLDYISLLSNLDDDTRDMFHYIMAFQGVQDPLYLIQALEYINISKDKEKALYTLLDDYERQPFEVFKKRIEKNQNKRIEIAEREYADSTEGYIDFLTTLKKEI